MTLSWSLKDELEEAVTIAVFPAEPGSGVSKSWGTEGDPSSFSEFWEANDAGVQGGEEGTWLAPS